MKLTRRERLHPVGAAGAGLVALEALARLGPMAAVDPPYSLWNGSRS